MEILTKAELQLRFNEIADKIKEGAIFIHPTDTIYGIGCNALNEQAVQKIREIKNRPDMPLSIWVPSKKWIENNCTSTKNKWVEALPGPYTLILKLKDKKVVANSVAPSKDTIGVRFPDHWFTKVVERLDIPLITTSANKSGEKFMTSLENLDPEIQKEVDFMIYEGEKEARPSKIVNVEKEEVKER